MRAVWSNLDSEIRTHVWQKRFEPAEDAKKLGNYSNVFKDS